MFISSIDQAVLQHGTLQMSDSEPPTFLTSSLGHVLISKLFFPAENTPESECHTNATQMIQRIDIVRAPGAPFL